MKLLQSACAAAWFGTILLLVACGGGGSNNSDAAPTPGPTPTPTPTPLPSFSVGGGITGLLTASGLTLVNGSETLPIAPNATSFTFANKVIQNGAYSVSIGSQPTGLTCTVSNAAGTVALAAVQSVVVNCTPVQGKSPFMVSTFAGDDGQTLVDGVGASARFGAIQAIAMDGAGIRYVADSLAHTVRRISPSGVVTTLAGNGTAGLADGVGAAARFNAPTGVAVDSAGNVYVADSENHAIRKVSPTGVVSTLAGNGQAGLVDGVATLARFNRPQGIAVDASGAVYVADTDNSVVRKISPTGAASTLAGNGRQGFADGVGANASFDQPVGIVVDGVGNAYVTSNTTVRKVSPTGAVSTMAGSYRTYNAGDGVGVAAQFSQLAGIALDRAGNLYVADPFNLAIRKITAAAVVTTVAGLSARLVDGLGAYTFLERPTGVVVDSAGGMTVVERNRTVHLVSPTGVVTLLAGQGINAGLVNGTSTVARFNAPNGVATDGAGYIYVADTSNGAIRKIAPSGMVTTVAQVNTSVAADPGFTRGNLTQPTQLVVDSTGNVYVVDQPGYVVTRIVKVSPSGAVTSLGATGLVDVNGAPLPRQFPQGIAVDGAGFLYISSNNSILKISPAGVVTNYAGSASAGFTDGLSANARFNSPRGLAVDSVGNLFVADYSNNAIRKITSQGQVTTLASAGLSGPLGVVIAGAGNFYAVGGLSTVDFQGSPHFTGGAVYKVTSDGVVSIVAGGLPGRDEGAGTAARFDNLQGIAMDNAGNIYVADTNNNAIRKVVP